MVDLELVTPLNDNISGVDALIEQAVLATLVIRSKNEGH
jgi:hypothetical protein